MREQLASVARAVTTLGSSSLHPSPSPPAVPAGHHREEEWPVLESSGGGRCPTVRQHTPLNPRLSVTKITPTAGMQTLAFWILIFTLGQSKRMMRRTETNTGVSLPCQSTLKIQTQNTCNCS